MIDEVPEFLYCLPGGDEMYDSPRATYESQVAPWLPTDESWPPVTIERWSVHDPMDHMPSPDLVTDVVGEWIANHGDVTEGGPEAFDAVLRSDVTRGMVTGLFNLIVGQVKWRQGKDLVGTHTVTWDADGRPLLDGGPLRHPSGDEMVASQNRWQRVGGRNATAWIRDVREVWRPVLDAMEVGTVVLANGCSYWTKTTGGLWESGDNRVSTLSLLLTHDEFVEVDRPL